MHIAESSKQWQLIAGGFSHVNYIQICEHVANVIRFPCVFIWHQLSAAVMWPSCDVIFDSCMCIGACSVIWWDDEGPCVTSWRLLPLTKCCVQCWGGKNWGNVYTYTYAYVRMCCVNVCTCVVWMFVHVCCVNVCTYVCVHVYNVMLEYTVHLAV